MKIADNFLDQEEFIKLQTFMMDGGFAWHYNDGIDDERKLNKFQFIHMFYNKYVPISLFVGDEPVPSTIRAFFIIKSNILKS